MAKILKPLLKKSDILNLFLWSHTVHWFFQISHFYIDFSNFQCLFRVQTVDLLLNFTKFETFCASSSRSAKRTNQKGNHKSEIKREGERSYEACLSACSRTSWVRWLLKGKETEKAFILAISDQIQRRWTKFPFFSSSERDSSFHPCDFKPESMVGLFWSKMKTNKLCRVREAWRMKRLRFEMCEGRRRREKDSCGG